MLSNLVRVEEVNSNEGVVPIIQQIENVKSLT